MAEATPKKDRRHPRFKPPKGVFVAWEAGTRRAVSRLEALSIGGIFIHTPEPPSVGSTLNILIDLQDGDVRARAIVRRITPTKGMGIEFVSMTPEDRARLNRQLQHLLAV